VKDAGGKRRIGLARAEDFGKMRDSPCASAGNDRDTHGTADGGCKFAVEAVSHAVRIHRGKQDLSRATRLGFPCPFDDSTASISPPSVSKYSRALNGIARVRISPRVDGHNDRLRAKAGADLADQGGVGERGGVDAHLVGASFENRFSVAGGANASSDSEGDKERLRSAADSVQQRRAALVRSSDVQQHDFVRALLRMAMRQRSRVAGVNQVEKLDAFDDAPIAAVEAGNNAAS